jgi:hypothetical protein
VPQIIHESDGIVAVPTADPVPPDSVAPHEEKANRRRAWALRCALIEAAERIEK